MESIVRSVILSFLMGISCKVFFETIVPKREYRYRWIGYTVIFAFTAGFMVIAFTKIPPYILQPVRFIAVIAVIAQFYYRIGVMKNLILSILFCGVYWIISILIMSVIYVFSVPWLDGSVGEAVTVCVHLCLTLVFHYRYKNRIRGLSGVNWEKFGLFPLFSMIVIMAISMMPWDGTVEDRNAKLVAASGFAIINLCTFYFVGDMLEKEEEMQRLRLFHERTQNQMNMYRNMQKNYEQQRRYMHDYKNQLNCIQGMLGSGQTEETLEYISKLTGSIMKNADYVNTNHAVVNVVLNQKYRDAYEKGITVTMAVNDLSELTMSEEEIVTLLVNLIDNAIEACEKLDGNKIIQFKMMLEDGQLILSIRNPIKEPVSIKGNTVFTSKQDKSMHGIGLLNVDSVIKKNDGTSILKCEDGWFYFSALIPVQL